jgi:DNA polymerase III delta prime subunit
MNETEILWTERYRPKRVKDTILPAGIKKSFQEFVNTKKIPNLLLTGPPGSGKTTIARAMLEEIGYDYMFINASLDRNIDTLRNDILNYASTISFTGTRKYVILDEADYLNPNSVQPALRNFIESFSKNCGFILTCNYIHKIIEPLRNSRFAVIDFKIPKAERQRLAAQFLKRIEDILKGEKVAYDDKVIIELVRKWFPDWRRILNELQRHAVSGKIDEGVLAQFDEVVIKEIIELLKEQEFRKVRKWVGEHADMEVDEFYQKLFEALPKYMTNPGYAQAVLFLAEYKYQAAFSVNPEINICACLVALMQLKDGWV